MSNMQYKTKTKKYLGQNFLQDENIIQKIIKLANIKKYDTVIEIGPGLGALTRYLLTSSNNVNVVEYDSSIIKILLSNCNDYGIPKIFNEDFLKFDLTKIPQNKIKLIGNLPYNISTPIIFKVIELNNRIIDVHFMLQKEMVDRIISIRNNKSYGRISVILQYHFKCDFILDVPPQVFHPQPKVNSAILRLTPHLKKITLKNYSFFEKIVKQSFSQRRKTLYNNLKDIFKELNVDMNNVPVNTKLRAENLSVKDFVTLSNYLS